MFIRVTTSLAAVAVLGLAGCGSSSTTQSAGGSPGATATPATVGSASPTTANSPSGVVDAYWKALEAGDCTTAYGLTVDPATKKYISVANLCKSIQLDSVKSHQVGDVTEQTATSAKVKVTVVRGSGTKMTPIVTVMLVGGIWKISDFST